MATRRAVQQRLARSDRQPLVDGRVIGRADDFVRASMDMEEAARCRTPTTIPVSAELARGDKPPFRLVSGGLEQADRLDGDARAACEGAHP
ncbi:MAG: hypothetical protein P8R46_08915, partial [Planctomycetota bacterium]|nr:hypothetical protein [Planctomycetota bacterium]